MGAIFGSREKPLPSQSCSARAVLSADSGAITQAAGVTRYAAPVLRGSPNLRERSRPSRRFAWQAGGRRRA